MFVYNVDKNLISSVTKNINRTVYHVIVILTEVMILARQQTCVLSAAAYMNVSIMLWKLTWCGHFAVILRVC